MPQVFKRFNNLCTKAHDNKIHLNKPKKIAKESGGKTGCLFATMVAQRRKPNIVDSSSSKKPYVTKPEAGKKIASMATLIAAQV